MQQATYRSPRPATEHPLFSGLKPRIIIQLLVAEMAALASLGFALVGSLLITASYLL